MIAQICGHGGDGLIGILAQKLQRWLENVCKVKKEASKFFLNREKPLFSATSLRRVMSHPGEASRLKHIGWNFLNDSHLKKKKKKKSFVQFKQNALDLLFLLIANQINDVFINWWQQLLGQKNNHNFCNC